MTLVSVPLESITENHLRSLIEDRVAEARVIEYKRELPARPDESKREFLADVCSFANTAGGDIVYGMIEDDGMPQELVGFETSDIDGERNRLDNLIRDGIGPRLSHVYTHLLNLANGRYALVLRVPRSFSRPHVVTFRNHWRFYTRSSTGKYPMAVDEVRQAFVLSESVADRIRAFRADRLGRIVSGETPVPIEGTGRVVLHMVPISAFDSPTSVVDLDTRRPPLSEGGALRPISEPGGSLRYNFDGVLRETRLGAEVLGYVALFRTGVVEAVDNDAAFIERDVNRSRISSEHLEKSLIEAVEQYFRLLQRLGVVPPLYLLLSLLSVQDYEMIVDPHMRYQARPIDRADLVVPEVVVESLEQDRPGVERLMRPLLDAVWNACGLSGSPNYDASGRWNPRR